MDPAEEILESAYSGISFDLDQDDWSEVCRQLSNRLPDPVVARPLATIIAEFAEDQESRRTAVLGGNPLLPQQPPPRRQRSNPPAPRGPTGPTQFGIMPDDDDEPDLPAAAVPPLFGSTPEPKAAPNPPSKNGGGWFIWRPSRSQMNALAMVGMTMAIVVIGVQIVRNLDTGATGGSNAATPAAAPPAQQA
ncbi:hypothetical protein KKH03_03455, partial [Patescibacteria group bacterium]|nr:hypothetical protein [Patescibacteria group bacterium]